ncbi:hypothetical protein PROFUN_09977 [Planoprotostelium fungivorum]|uniref:BZIP domain-containing protein n=1 Tax=Planoprotostelium fungivorum TaxID=1890364 RepID=A0A2P6NFL2_9EUKA|nr:hypothetical protein PROFUN_09977 [Planoprotostelium fungivorum]
MSTSSTGRVSVTDLPNDQRERKRLQNRVAQRKYREKQRQKLIELQEKADQLPQPEATFNAPPTNESNLIFSPDYLLSTPITNNNVSSSDRIMELEQKLAEAEKRCNEMRESLKRYMVPQLPHQPNQIQPSESDSSSDFQYLQSSSSSSPLHQMTEYMAAGDMVVRKVHCVRAAKEAATWSFPDENNILLEKVNLIRAMFYNGEMLNILHNGFAKEHILNDDSQSPFCSVEINIPPNLLDNLPPNLRPTHLQMVTPHHPYIDLLPWPAFRDRLLSVANLIDEDVLCADMHDNGEGFVVWGSSPNDEWSWEISEYFAKKYWFLMDYNMLRSTNWWRSQRGQPPLRIKLNA